MNAALKENNTIKEYRMFDVNLTRGYKRRTKPDGKYPKNSRAKLPFKFSSSTFLEVFVLYTLAQSPSGTYGMDILNRISGSVPKEIWKPSHGNLYPILNKLVTEGCITKEVIVKDKMLKNNMKIYKITDLGLYALEERLEAVEPMLKRTERFFSETYKAFYK